LNKAAQTELISLIQNGDIKAFDKFYKQNWRPLYQMAYHSTGSIEDAKDLVQNVFINFWNVRYSIDVNQYHSSYLFTSLRNSIINLYKKDAVKKRGLEELLHFDNKPVHTHEDHYIAKELAQSINTRVEELPRKMQRVFVLSRYEHLSINEISETLNIAPRTVKNQLSNALKILRTHVGTCGILLFYIFFK
jgi:RNA polymerase sigma-70 factor (ECF subfamily)